MFSETLKPKEYVAVCAMFNALSSWCIKVPFVFTAMAVYGVVS